MANKDSAATVVVGCRVPNGLVLHLDGHAQKYTLRGPAQKLFMPGSDVYCGHGLTEIPLDFWKAWVAANKEYGPYKAGFIFAQTDVASVRAEAQEKQDHNLGLEPLDPRKPGSGIEATPDMAKVFRAANIHGAAVGAE